MKSLNRNKHYPLVILAVTAGILVATPSKSFAQERTSSGSLETGSTTDRTGSGRADSSSSRTRSRTTSIDRRDRMRRMRENLRRQSGTRNNSEGGRGTNVVTEDERNQGGRGTNVVTEDDRERMRDSKIEDLLRRMRILEEKVKLLEQNKS